MINLREVEDTIHSLESGSATYNNCMKLASLYIIRDELMKKEGQYTNYTYGSYRPMMYERKPMMYAEDDMMIHETRK